MSNNRREILKYLTGAVAGIGVVLGAIPFIRSMLPSAGRVPPEERWARIDISKLEPGQILSVSWNNQPIYILRRKPETIRRLLEDNPILVDPESKESEQAVKVDSKLRSIQPELAVLSGVCTHLGCAVAYQPPTGNGEKTTRFADGAFYCPCHSSEYDLAGRVHKNMPAPRNLAVPPYEFESDKILRLGFK